MFLLLLFFPLMLLSAFGESVPDYNDPYSPIFTDKPKYTWTDKIKMTILAPSWNTDRHLIDSIGDSNDHPIKISTREHSLEPYRFTETDVNSGIFTGEVILTGFSHDANGDGNFDTTPRTTGSGPTSGFLESGRDSAVTISFEFAQGVIVTESVPVGWNVGTIQLSKDVFFSDDSVIARVFDPDMNLNPESLDHVQIQLSSDSDVAGIEVDGIETSESSGLFVGTVSLSSTLPSSGSRLYSLPGDKIFVKYDDHTLPKPYSTLENLKIRTQASVESSVPPIERLQSLPITLSDSSGNPLQLFSSDSQIQVVGTVTNDDQFRQKFVYFFQIKNESGYVDSISWVQGELSSGQTLDVSQSWIPKKPGTYIVETFVWDSLTDLTALSPSTSTSISIQ